MKREPYYVRELKKAQMAEEQDNFSLSPRIMIASAGSSKAANRVALGLLAVWKEQGHNPIAYSVGPQYDFLHALRLASGHDAYTLDSWFHDKDDLSYLLTHYSESSRVSLIHARTNYFDTLSPMQFKWSELQEVPSGSPAELARKSQTPVILVIDARDLNFTKLAYLKGLLDFRPNEVIAGFILAGMEESNTNEYKKQFELELELPLLGTVSLPILEDDVPALAGIAPNLYEEMMAKKIDKIRQELYKSLDISRILKIADMAPQLDQDLPQSLFSAQRILGFETRRYRLGLAYDEAFSYYYQENLDLLQEMGAEIVRFSPLKDPILPPDLDGLYFGGGKLLDFLAEASENEGMLKHIYRKVNAGIPVIAEGSASLYLSREFISDNGRRWPLVGVVPSSARLNPEIDPPYYGMMSARREDLLSSAGTSIPCLIENPYVFDPAGAAYRVNIKGQGYHMEGFSTQNIWSCQASLHFYAEPLMIAKFTKQCMSLLEERLAYRNEGLESGW